MFEEQNPNPNKVEDIFSATEPIPASALGAPPIAPLGPPSALAQGKLQPAAEGTVSALPPDQLSGENRASFPIKKALAIAVVSLVVVGGAGAGWFWWQTRSASVATPLLGSPTTNQPITNTAPTTPPADTGLGQSLDQFNQNAINQALNPLATSTPAITIDTDSDGLTDSDEINTYRTDILKPDTDGDGLSDWEEVKIYTTDPNRADTDGDTYSDGVEVQNGFNPKGGGKLLDFQQAKQNAQ